ncbi:MAG: tripartite tricarboxylate transporter TctB family protein [Pseudomonadota bacterium]
MTVRVAELVMCLLMAAMSAYFMYEASKLPIGWIEDEGPGGGFWPFWLSAVMFGSCVWIFANWVRRIGPVAQSTERFFSPGVFAGVAPVAGLLILTVALIDGIGFLGLPGIGLYLALPIFLFVYVRIFGGHSWVLTTALVVLTPVVTFLFFEIVLTITLPKGITDLFFQNYIFPIFY